MKLFKKNEDYFDVDSPLGTLGRCGRGSQLGSRWGEWTLSHEHRETLLGRKNGTLIQYFIQTDLVL